MPLTDPRPSSIRNAVVRPRRTGCPSPVDWRHEVLYFLLPDRFSDGQETALLDRTNLDGARGAGWDFQHWAESGALRFQGGTIAGVTSKLDYLKGLGVTAVWVGPVWKQRLHLDDYHGYKIQDFLDADPRFGTRADLVALVTQAHERGIRVIFDVLVNHTGENWLYPPDSQPSPLRPFYREVNEGPYAFGSWLDADGNAADAIRADDDGVWPVEFQDTEHYTRAGFGSFDIGRIDDPDAQFRRCDHYDRNLFTERSYVLDDLIRCWQYWMELTDCDGFRIDTLKHIGLEDARMFCGAIKEFAAAMGKDNFLLVGEVGGGDDFEDYYLDVLGTNLDAVLDVDGLRWNLRQLAKGKGGPGAFFGGSEGDRR